MFPNAQCGNYSGKIVIFFDNHAECEGNFVSLHPTTKKIVTKKTVIWRIRLNSESLWRKNANKWIMQRLATGKPLQAGQAPLFYKQWIVEGI